MDKIRALIVDDSSVMRKIVERSLHWKRLWKPRNGAEALAALQSNVVALILCDINMPVMDGLEFVRQVATVETAKGVDIVILGDAWTVTPIAQAAAPVQGPAATPVATKTPKSSPAAVLKPTVVKSVDPRLQP